MLHAEIANVAVSNAMANIVRIIGCLLFHSVSCRERVQTIRVPEFRSADATNELDPESPPGGWRQFRVRSLDSESGGQKVTIQALERGMLCPVPGAFGFFAEGNFSRWCWQKPRRS